MNNPNTEWFWNSSANNHLSLPSSNGVLMQRSSAISSDIGISFGMRNVNLNGTPTCFIKNLPHCCKYSIPRSLIPPNWYNHYSQHLRCEAFLTKHHQTPLIVSNDLNRMITNEYSSFNISDRIFEWRHNTVSANTINRIDNMNLSIGKSDLISTTTTTATNKFPINKDDFLDPSLAPPKKKWIRHYMMEEPFLNEHTVARPLVVIPSQNHHQHLNNNHHHPTHSLSPQSYDASRSRSSSLSSNPITVNGVHHVLTGGEDSSQSSLNLSASSGYLSGSSANSSVGGSSLNLSGTTISATPITGTTTTLHLNHMNGVSPDHQTPPQPQQLTTNRRRTISSNSNGGTQRSPCILRAGTREVHNKLEKNRRAHLKECFEQLRKQLLFSQEEKKTSNLSILGNACRTVQTLKRKDRELEHEMERLAKEKVAQQKRILILKRELNQQFGHDVVLADPDASLGIHPRERFSSESLSEPSLPSSGRARYSSTSSLSSAATATSPCTAGIPTQSAMTISSIIPSNVQSPTSSPQRPLSSSPTTIPLSLITTTKYNSTSSSNDSSQSLKITPIVSNGLPNGLTNGTNHHHNNGGNHIAINFTTSDGVISPALITTTSAMPINLNVSKAGQISQGLQIITTTNNNHITTNKLLSGKNGVRQTIEHVQQQQQHQQSIITKVESLTSSKKSETEPPTKVLKLINGSILASVVDKDHKLIPAGLTLSQVVSLPVRVIGSTPMATIELSNSNVQRNHNHLQTANGAQLQKLLVNGTSANITTVNTVMTTSSNKIANEFPRLPGGAELNILPNGTNGLYRSNGKVAIVNNGFNIKEFLNTADANANGRSVHMVTPMQSNSTPISGLTPIVVSQGQNGTNLTHIIASSPQLAGKVVTTPLSVNGQALPIMGTQYLSTAVVKPVVVTVAGNGNTVHNGSITLPITSSTATNGGSA